MKFNIDALKYTNIFISYMIKERENKLLQNFYAFRTAIPFLFRLLIALLKDHAQTRKTFEILEDLTEYIKFIDDIFQITTLKEIIPNLNCLKLGINASCMVIMRNEDNQKINDYITEFKNGVITGFIDKFV